MSHTPLKHQPDFIKKDDYFYNLNFMRNMYCDNNMCKAILSNVSLRCHKDTDPDCYNQMASYYKSLEQRIPQTKPKDRQ
jgi:hypothetical protein